MDCKIIFLKFENYGEHNFIKVIVDDDFITTVYIPNNKLSIKNMLKVGENVNKLLTLRYNYKTNSITLSLK